MRARTRAASSQWRRWRFFLFPAYLRDRGATSGDETSERRRTLLVSWRLSERTDERRRRALRRRRRQRSVARSHPPPPVRKSSRYSGPSRRRRRAACPNDCVGGDRGWGARAQRPRVRRRARARRLAAAVARLLAHSLARRARARSLTSPISNDFALAPSPPRAGAAGHSHRCVAVMRAAVVAVCFVSPIGARARLFVCRAVKSFRSSAGARRVFTDSL